MSFGRLIVKSVALCFILSGCSFSKERDPELYIKIYKKSDAKKYLNEIYSTLGGNRKRIALRLIQNGFECFRGTRKEDSGKYALLCDKVECSSTDMTEWNVISIRVAKYGHLPEERIGSVAHYPGSCANVTISRNNIRRSREGDDMQKVAR